MRSYMILSTLDVAARANNREHHLIAFMRERVDAVWVVYRCLPSPVPQGTGAVGRVRRLLTTRTRVWRDGTVHYVSVEPPLNLGQGGLKDDTGPGSLVRRAVSALLGEAGILKDLATILALAGAARRYGPTRVDVAAGLSPWGAAAALLLRRRGRAGAVFYDDRDYEAGFVTGLLRPRWARWLETTSIRRADGGLSIGHRLARLRAETAGRVLPVVTSGVDVAAAAARPVPPPMRRLVYAGRVAPWNGLDVVITALALTRDRFPELRLEIFGDVAPTYRVTLGHRAARLGLGERVRLHGRQPHATVREQLAEGGLGIATLRPVPLRTYAFPLKVLDYMAAGLPVIGSANSETADLLERHACGLAPPLEARAIADAIVALMGDPETYRRLAANGRAAVSAYDLARVMGHEYDLLAACARPTTPQPERAAPCTS